MAVQTVSFRTGTTPAAEPHHVEDVIYVLAQKEANVQGAAGTLFEGKTEEAFFGTGKLLATGAGTSGIKSFLDDLFQTDDVDPWVYVMLFADTENLTSIEAKMDLFENADRPPTILTGVGDMFAKVNSGANAFSAWTTSYAATPLATKMESMAEHYICRAYLPTGATTVANAETWGSANTGERVLGIFNPIDNKQPNAHWLNGLLIQTSDRGRGWGINGARVFGGTSLLVPLSPDSSDVATLDTDHVSSVVLDQGVMEIMGGEFHYQTADPERFVNVARRMDYIKQRGKNFARHNLLSSDYTLLRMARELNENASAIVGSDGITRINYIGVSEVSDTRVFDLEVTMRVAANTITIYTHLSV